MDEIMNHYTLVEGLSHEYRYDCPLLETYGKDLKTVKKLYKKNPRKVWTVIDVGLNYLMVIAGFHHANRINYVISVQERKDENEEYIY